MSQLTSGNPTTTSTASLESATRASWVSDLVELTKARLATLVVITALMGFYMGWAQASAAASVWWTLAITLTGVALACLGAGALNEVVERKRDARMKRTSDRPVAAGRMSPLVATIVGVSLAVVGVGLLAMLGLYLAAALCLFTVVSYVLIYTPLKVVHSSSTLVGAVPGAMPPVIGYAAATGEIGLPALVLFAIMFAWQLPHFLAIAWLYRDDYAKGGFAMLSVVDPTGRRTFRHALLWCVALLIIGCIPTILGISSWIALVGATLAGVGFLYFAIKLFRSHERRDARALFLASLAYLPITMLLVVLDRA